MIVLEVIQGLSAGRTFELPGEIVTLGRSPESRVVLEDAHVSGEHARIVSTPDRVILQDLRSTNGTTLVRDGERIEVTADQSPTALRSGDVIELGSGDTVTSLRVTLVEESDEARVLSLRKLDEVEPTAEKLERDPTALSALYAAQKRIGAATDLDLVLVAVSDASLLLVPAATHVTIVLRDDEQDADTTAAAYVPVLTRVRQDQGGSGPPSGPVPITRSVYRRVIRERAAVLTADAPGDVSSTESLIGASIKSTIGVPLWKGEEIIGVLQVDNRSAPGALGARDVETLLVLAANASLAVANARLIQRLVLAEDRLRKENTFLKGREEKRRGGKEAEIIGQSEPMLRLIHQLDKVVDTRVTVLIEGETGTGKELIAAAVHYRSRRRDKLFVAQNCAALAESLLESELFGHKKGSFTGAHEEKKGLFEIADGGTLFLDEITETPPSLQSKLLRALQEGEIRPVGGTSPKHVNVRIVAATNRNLEQEVAQGRFREDLYYRLKVFPLRIPPLRERREDIPLLADHFLKRYGHEIGKPVGGFAQQTMELMVAYNWPGNVRELQNEVQRLVIQVDPGAFVTQDLLSPRIRQVEGLVTRAGVTRGTLREMMDSVEKFFLIEALREHNNNKTNAARSLGITREGLHKKLRQYGI
ncbi:sigma-54-dependent Fis family transcriptional regulator [Chondromyces apiculatus]|uniref:Response regulator of zinc sigma-54-dependent two-component system n=1 Tax=Chondromyces apiculatus DSM 436 TaxID=1192034 RepID=A0A017SYB3_9BACT|nr:sigma-54-dependent Fis family transcriptional regulator [Chondromyces apiculatus]EYF01296.1 Response regulator of zinc sigma-54-dependent two-component system [Chondromyces apiculatus DSM 436]